jgi:hypothetical protein
MKPPAAFRPKNAAKPAPPPVYRPGPPPVSQLKQNSPVGTAPPVYRPAPPAPIQQRPAPPVFKPPTAHPLMLKPGVIQRSPETAAQALFEKGYKVVKKSDLKGAFAKQHDVTDKEVEAVQTALTALREATPAKKRVEADDITSDYNPRFACVLQTVIYIKGTVFGKSSPKELHELIWAEKGKLQPYRQYDDDSVTPLFYTACGLTAKKFPADSTMETLPANLAAGKYAVGVSGTVEDHMYILDVTKDGFAWKEYDQNSQRGFKDARINKNGEIKSVYG